MVYLFYNGSGYMKTSTIIIIIVIIVVLIAIISIVALVKKFLRKLGGINSELLLFRLLLSKMPKQEIEYSETPKSLSGLDSVLLPKISNDFPEINISELKSAAEHAILAYYESLNENKVKKIPNTTSKFTLKLEEAIKNNKDIKYNSVKIHRTVINAYDNKDGICRIILQTGLEYYKKTAEENTKVQDRLNTEFIYVYDETKGNISLNCPNCGAPIKKLGIKSCPYCETGLVELFAKTWQIDDIYKK